jgi:hypothetical protein
MNCEESKNMITISLYGKLTPSETAQLERHLRECPRCAGIHEKSAEWSHLFNEKDDIPLPDKEKSWQIISDRGIKSKGGWLERLAPKKPAFQFASVLFVLAAGFAAGYFFRSGWQKNGEIVQLRQEVLQVREIAAASLLRQESLNRRLRTISPSFAPAPPDEQALAYLIRTLKGEPDVTPLPASIDDPYLFLMDSAVRQDFIQSLSEQTTPLVDTALALARYIGQLNLH